MFRAPLAVRSIAKASQMRAFSVPHFAHSKPSEGKNFPKWVQTMENTTAHSKLIAGFLIGSSAVSFVIWSIVRSFGDHPKTLSNDWKAANKEYMKFQNMNPIFGVSSKP